MRWIGIIIILFTCVISCNSKKICVRESADRKADFSLCYNFDDRQIIRMEFNKPHTQTKNIRETNELIAHLEASNLVCQLEVEKLEAEALRCQRELENNSNTSCDVPYNIQCDCE